ncbi:unnamed protein product [Clonostachys rosea]|uniref:Nephrocystin 3-like N-terminal domain-containing protein n=1 Tax=Bionectria ochroleuca TaxID=29856 RepID=A0ABY6ULG1_BIOOC|nr:unnamed protein product [Clonostachys rosea]
MSSSSKAKVYRLRNIPAHFDRLLAVEWLARTFGDVSQSDVQIHSLALSVDTWSTSPTKTATVTFGRMPFMLGSIDNTRECVIQIPELARPLIVDDHFQGMTPLNSVAKEAHQSDCVIISGLASHPFGSWQPRGSDKSFMWIRDDLPPQLPGVRFLLYGYETKLQGSKSFQSIPDLAISLINSLKTIGWSSLSAKPAALLAHSLGGVVVKQALVMLAGSGVAEQAMLMCIKGAIFFGVPSQGMIVPDIRSMVGDQPNKALVHNLSDQSPYIADLDSQFDGISYLQKLRFFWAFETKITPTVSKLSTGEFSRTGPETVMVSKESATRGLCNSCPALTIQIDEDHSNMVKFSTGDYRIDILASKLSHILGIEHKALLPEITGGLKTQIHLRNETVVHVNGRDKIQWNDDVIVDSIRAPERDRRLEQINTRIGHTFDWAFDNPAVNLTKWLQNGTGLFWVSGKPGCGKSTFMKYIFNDERTAELLHRWKSGSQLMTVSFFFHHRGTNLQKSFEGLLRSLVSQILEKKPSLVAILHPILDKLYLERIEIDDLGDLRSDLHELFRTCRLDTDRGLDGLEGLIQRQDELSASKTMGTEIQDLLKRHGVNVAHLKPARRSDEVGKFLVAAAVDNGLGDPTTLDGLLRRQYQRQKIKSNIQTGRWSRESLEEALQRLITQTYSKLDICLFIDALDEYVGQPEYIVSFLHDLVQSSTQSWTRFRIIFSSRPWAIFKQEFAACPGFQVHEHTEEDIFEFCIAKIPPNPTATSLLEPLVTEICTRARGVFLWVTLVMRDLASVTREQGYNLEKLKEKVQKTLDSLPDELDQYYVTIIERIPSGFRWYAYVALELICRAEAEISLDDIVCILDCSTAHTVEEARARTMRESRISRAHVQAYEKEGYIRMLSGGLIDIVYHDRISRVEFMHQTIKEFVEDSQFRALILKEWRADFTRENGHSFLAKYYFLTRDFNQFFIYHARQSELSTGLSQYELYAKASPKQYNLDICSFDGDSLIAFSVFFGLELCMRDAYSKSPFLERYSNGLVSILDAAANRTYGMDIALSIARYLVEHGMRGERDIRGMEQISKTMWARNPSSTNTQALITLPDDEYEDLMCILLEALPRPTEMIPIEDTSHYLQALRFQRDLIHTSPPALAQALIERGVDANQLDSDGRTPIDSIIGILTQANPPEPAQYHHELCSLFLRHGGVLSKSSPAQWRECIHKFASAGFDVHAFERVIFPGWDEQEEPARSTTRSSKISKAMARIFRKPKRKAG